MNPANFPRNAYTYLRGKYRRAVVIYIVDFILDFWFIIVLSDVKSEFLRSSTSNNLAWRWIGFIGILHRNLLQGGTRIFHFRAKFA